MFLDDSYFQGELAIPNLKIGGNATGVASMIEATGEASFDWFVEKYEREALGFILGDKLRDEFLAGLEGENPEKWEKLRDVIFVKGEYYSYSPVANYVYMMITRYGQTQPSMVGEVRKRAKSRARVKGDEKSCDADGSKKGGRGKRKKREENGEEERRSRRRRNKGEEDGEEEMRGRGKRRKREEDGEEERRARGRRRQKEGRRRRNRDDTSSSDQLDWDALKNARFYTPSPSETSEMASDEEVSTEEREEAPGVSALRDPDTPAKGLSVTFNITPKQEGVSEKRETAKPRDSVTEIAASLDDSESFFEEEEEEDSSDSYSSDRLLSDTVDVSTKLGRSIVRLPNGVTIEVSSNSDIGIDFNADFPHTESSELEMHDSSIRVSTNLIDSV